ncbi:MAG: peptidylprolyl isomerase [Hellea sp.]|nr:peptidylprolyl isomerase [Hellea sp.]
MIRYITAFFAALILVACGSKSDSNIVILETQLGKIEIEVFPDKAPASTQDFLFYVEQGLFNDRPELETGFYRVVYPENDNRKMGMSLIQGGTLDLKTYSAGVIHESTAQTGLSNVAGSVALARYEPGTGNAGAFFINIENNLFLDYGGVRNPDGQGYAVFGRVTKGMDIVKKIQALRTYDEESRHVLPPDFPIEIYQTLYNPVRIKKAYRK